jgi:hypothetical protein
MRLLTYSANNDSSALFPRALAPVLSNDNPSHANMTPLQYSFTRDLSGPSAIAIEPWLQIVVVRKSRIETSIGIRCIVLHSITRRGSSGTPFASEGRGYYMCHDIKGFHIISLIYRSRKGKHLNPGGGVHSHAHKMRVPRKVRARTA